METLKRLLYKEKNGEFSHTKLWSNIGYFLMCIVFIGITIFIGLGYSFPVNTWIDLFMTFGAFVAIPRGFSKWIAYKKGCACGDETKSEDAGTVVQSGQGEKIS